MSCCSTRHLRHFNHDVIEIIGDDEESVRSLAASRYPHYTFRYPPAPLREGGWELLVENKDKEAIGAFPPLFNLKGEKI